MSNSRTKSKEKVRKNNVFTKHAAPSSASSAASVSSASSASSASSLPSLLRQLSIEAARGTLDQGVKTEIKAKLFDPAAWQSGPRYVADVQVDTENIDSLPLVSLLCMVSACEKDGSIDGEQKCMIKALLLSGHNRKERMGAAMLVRSKSWEKRSVHVNTHADSNRNKDIFDESEEKQKSYGEDMSGFSHGVGSITSAEERTANKLAMENEKVAMESIYGEEYKDLGLADNGLAFIQVQIIHHLIPTKKAFTFDLIFRIFPNYPKVPPTFEVQSVNCLLTDEVYELQQLLLDSAYALLGEVMLFDLTLAAQNFLYEAYMERTETRKKMRIAKLEEGNRIADQKRLEAARQLALAAAAAPGKHVKPMAFVVPRLPPPESNNTVNHIDWAQTDIIVDDEKYNEVLSSSHVDTFSSFKRKYKHSMASLYEHLLNLHKTHSIQRVENITNVRLESKFNNMRELHPRKEVVWAWHGTSIDVVSNIVKHGLLVPGEASGVRIANGSAYGVGIYLARNASMSLGYTRGRGCSRLLLCKVLTVPNMVKIHDWGYVATSSAVVLPCFAIDVWNSVPAGDKEATSMHDVLDQSSHPRTQEEMDAYARRNLPYGFGGGAFQVLEVAEVDDDNDETTYEELQHLKAHTRFYVSEYMQERLHSDVAPSTYLPRAQEE